MLTRALLRTLRNDLPMPITIRQLGNQAPYSKFTDGHFRFLCPHCGELQATVNPHNNLAHCFNCGKNTNNIDLLISLGYDFKAAVELLQEWLRRHRQTPAPAPTSSRSPMRPNPEGARRLADILRQEFEKDASAT